MIAIVAGALANKAGNGGNAWARLSWTRGLERLGYEVYFAEQLSAAAPPGAVEYFEAVMREFGQWPRAALLDEQGRRRGGALEYEELLDVSAQADLLVNLSGHLESPELKRAVKRSVYIDDDPGYTQFWHASGALGERLEGHHAYYSYGTRIGAGSCPIPAAGVRWRAIHPPVVLADWPPASSADQDRFTTVATWRGPYGAVEWGGVRYGLKVHEFRKFTALPRHTAQRLEVALALDPAELSAAVKLRGDGWKVVDPRSVAHDPASFRGYVQGSGGEFSVAQGIYVDTRCGWFSDRSTRYLASGKPVLVQDTGFSHDLPAGEGLVAFRTLEEAVEGLRAIERSYDRHARAARALAGEWFDSDRVLRGLLEDVL